MDKQNALQDISYIRQLMQQTRQVLDIAWPIYIYWGIEIIASFLLSVMFINPAELASGGMSLSLVMKVLVEISLWGGLGWTAWYIYRHREEMINPKMFLIGTIGLSFVLIKIVETLGFRMVVTAVGYGHAGDLFSILCNGIYFGSVFIVLGLIYSREQLWLGYGLLAITLVALWMDINHVMFGYLGNWLQWNYIGAAFLIAGVMAYRRHRKQTKSEQ